MLIEVNEGFEKLTGYPREEALHKTVLNLGIWVNPADRQILLDQMGEKGRADELEFRLRHKNREERIGVISARAIEFHGQPCMVVVGRDVTERKQMEEQLRQAQKMESVGHLAAGVAHDFNNLLTIILGNSSLLEEQLLNQPDLLDPLKDIILAAEKAVNLTRQLLMFSRRQVMQTRMLNLNEIIGDLSKLLARLLREDIDLEFSYARSLPLICGDAGMLEQVIMNLVVNARDAMPGVGKLRIATSAEEFDEKDVERRPNIRIVHFVCVSFQDNGCGICPENLQQIFEPFFTTKEAGKGTGLGLATVYGIVKQHQGWVEVQSQIGAGARFDVYLPVCSKESGSQTVEPIKLKSHVGTETILIVEDDPSILNITATTLKRAGYRTLEYRSGAEAWSSHASKADQIHLILTDLVIPGGINGLEMSAKFASINPAIRLIVTSGYSVEIAKWRMLEQNNVKFIPKPYKMDQVLKAVRDSLDHLAWIPSAP
jgi:PAS domain S-box-containing protein